MRFREFRVLGFRVRVDGSGVNTRLPSKKALEYPRDTDSSVSSKLKCPNLKQLLSRWPVEPQPFFLALTLGSQVFMFALSPTSPKHAGVKGLKEGPF